MAARSVHPPNNKKYAPKLLFASQQNRGREAHQDVRHPVASVCEVGGRRARQLRLTLRHVDFDADRARDTEYRDEDVDRDDDDPAAGSGVPRVKPTDQKHGGAEPEATVNGTASAVPFVGE